MYLNPAVLLAHHQMLEKTTAKYPFKRVTVRQHTINAGTTNLNIDNIIMNVRPNVLLFAMLSNNSYSGSRDKNPFYFKHFDLGQFALYMDGKQIPSRPLTMSHTDGASLTSRAYNTLFNGTGIHFFDKGHLITKKMFDSGYFMLAFDLTTDHSYGSVCSNPTSPCSIRLEGTFKKNLSEAITCLVICEFDAQLEIDKFRSVALTV